MSVSAEDWVKGISLSILASMIGGASKLSIRKSWLIEAGIVMDANEDDENSHNNENTTTGIPLGGQVQNTTSYTFPSKNRRCNSQESEDNVSTSSWMSSRVDDINSRNSLTSPGHSSSPAAPRAALRQQSSASLSSTDSSMQRKRTRIAALCLRFSGMAGMSVLNPLCSVFAMDYASPSILAPFSGLTLVWIVLLSRPLIGEEPSRIQVIAASLIVTGEIIIAVFGDHSNDEGMTRDDVIRSYGDPLFISFFVMLTIWMLLLFYWIRYGRSLFLKRFAWGVSGGSITGLQNFLKDSLVALKAEDRHGFPWIPLLLALGAAITAFGGLLCLTACMKRYDATYSSAMFVGSFVVSASVMSVVHYHTFSHLESISSYILYPGGLLILLVGVTMLVREARRGDYESRNDRDIQDNEYYHHQLDDSARSQSASHRVPLIQPGDLEG